MKCRTCDALISQHEADLAAEIAGPDYGTLCTGCAIAVNNDPDDGPEADPPDLELEESEDTEGTVLCCCCDERMPEDEVEIGPDGECYCPEHFAETMSDDADFRREHHADMNNPY